MYSFSIIRVLETSFDYQIELSAKACEEFLSTRGYSLKKNKSVEAVLSDLKSTIFSLSRHSDLVVIIGATGFMKEDIGPEAALSLVDKRATSLEHAMMSNALQSDASLCLYRTAAGVISSSMVLAIPGVPECGQLYLEPIIYHLKSFIDDSRKN